MRLFLFAAGVLLLCSCYAPNQCVSVTDKHIIGQRNKYVYNYNKCPRGGSYHRWLFFIKR